MGPTRRLQVMASNWINAITNSFAEAAPLCLSHVDSSDAIR